MALTLGSREVILKAIRKFCLECVSTAKNVRECPCHEICPLHPYRMGEESIKEHLAMAKKEKATKKGKTTKK